MLAKPPVLWMVSGKGFFQLESDTSQSAAIGTLYQWHDKGWVLVGYHWKWLPDAVCNYGVTELELTWLLANIYGFEQKITNNYFEAIVDHTAIDYLKKSKHEPTSTRLTTLLGRLMKYTFDLKYLEGNKLKVSDALSRLYIEEKHKINDVIPLNFLLPFTDHQFYKQYTHLVHRLYAHKQIKTIAKSQCNYDRKAKNKPIERYQPPQIEKKTRQQKPGNQNTVQLTANKPDMKHKTQRTIDNAIGIFKIGNENPLDQTKMVDKPLTIKYDQIEKQVVNTIKDIPDKMYMLPHLLIEPQDKLSIFRKHILKQQEIHALLQDLRKRVLQNLMVNLDTKDLYHIIKIQRYL